VTADIPVWIDEMGAFAATASALFVLVGGFWAYFRFRKDAPYMARANLALVAELMTYDGKDLLRVKCTASAIGRGKFTFIMNDEYEPPNVAVYAMTPQILLEEQEEWTDVLTAIEVFGDDDSVEAGEILEEVSLVWVGNRPDRTVAYRVAASFTAADKEGSDPYTWQAVAVVPVEGLLHGGDDGNHGAGGNP
jgi:hypothetical protein